MNIKMCFVNTAMAATCVAAGGGVVSPSAPEDPTREPPYNSAAYVEGAIHAGPGAEGGAQGPASGAVARPQFGTSQAACGVPRDEPTAPNPVARTVDQWERWFQSHHTR